MTYPETFSQWRPHPWHGLNAGENPPRLVNAYIEMTPFDSVKYEVDKATGYLRVDRPQLTSSMPPSLYGFIPRTYCGDKVCALSPSAECGDGDPLDICVITERPINRGEVILKTRVIGGIKMIDGGEADDKIIGILDNDQFWKEAGCVQDLQQALLSRIRHYFATYKQTPEQETDVIIKEIYDHDHALKIVDAALQDYAEYNPHVE